MNRDKKVLPIIISITCGCITANAWALNTGDVLDFDPGVTSGYYGTVTGGSYFAMDFNGDGAFTENERTAISPGPSGGVIIGVAQPASGSHSGCPDGTESPDIDMPWCFFGNTGMHQTTLIPVTDNNDGTLDFSGWGVTWNGIPNIPLGGDPANFPTDTGNATISCTNDPCQAGDPFTLEYTAHVPLGDPSGFGGVHYQVHLEKGSGIPQPEIELTVDGGATQECSETGGSTVTVNADTTIPTGDSLDSVLWTVDGTAVMGTNSITEFLALGTHTVEATVTTTNGQTDTDSVNILVQDTTAPDLSLGFTDSLTGESIDSILHSRVHYVEVELSATDACDSDPSVQGTLIPLMEAVDGDVLKIFGNTGDVEIPTTAIQLTGTASDASGNGTSGQAILSVQQD